MKKTKIISPYNKTGKSNLTGFVNKTGVYIIYNALGEIVYVGYSGSNLYKTCLRHFQQWNDRTNQHRATFNGDNHKVRIILCTPAQALILENALIVKHLPNLNKQVKLLFPKAKIKKALDLMKEADLYQIENDLPF